MNALLVFVFAVVAHEFGHYAYAWVQTRERPHFSIKWWGFAVTIDDESRKVSIKHRILNHWTGIFAGVVVLFVFPVGETWWLIYLVACALDIAVPIILFGMMEEYKLSANTLLCDIPCDRCKHLSNAMLRAR